MYLKVVDIVNVNFRNIYYNLESLRIRNGLNKKKLSEVIDVSYNVYLRNEKEPDKFTIGELYKLKEFFNINSIEDLLK